MDSSAPLTKVDPRPIASPSNAPGYELTRHNPATASAPAFGMNPPQIPDHPSSMMDMPRPSNGYGGGPGGNGYNSGYNSGRNDYGHGGHSYSAPPPPASTMTAQPNKQRDLPTLKSHCQYGLREYMTLQRQRRRVDGTSTSTIDLENRLRGQQGVVISDLMLLYGEVRTMVKAAEGNRWRRWLMGGAIASFVPIIRRIFRRGSDQESKESSNNTEYAFKKSQGLVAYIKEGLLGNGSFAKIAFFVLGVLVVFQNEVSLRVAKTMQKRLRRLTARIERGDTDIDEKDLKMLEGWRWRVLMW